MKWALEAATSLLAIPIAHLNGWFAIAVGTVLFMSWAVARYTEDKDGGMTP